MGRSDVARRGGRVVLIALVSVMVVLVVAVVLVWRRGPATQPSFEEGQKVSEAFLASIREGHPEQAWQSTTAEFKSAQGRDRFLKYIKDKPFLKKPMRFVSVQTVTVQNSPRAEYVFRSPEGATVRLLAGNEAGTWRVDRMLVE